MNGLEFAGECDGLLKVEATGEAKLLAVRKTYTELVERCRLAGVWHVLLDARGLKGQLSVFELYEMSLHIAELFRSKSSRIAIVTASKAFDHNFSETACRNRGVDVKFSEDTRAAEAWLRDSAPQKSIFG